MDGAFLGAGSMHEALHLTFAITDMFERNLAAHPVVAGDERLRVLAEEVAIKLGQLYQAIGQLED